MARQARVADWRRLLSVSLRRARTAWTALRSQKWSADTSHRRLTIVARLSDEERTAPASEINRLPESAKRSTSAELPDQ